MFRELKIDDVVNLTFAPTFIIKDKKEMEIIYRFDPFEDADELKKFQQADKMHCVLWDFSQHLRDKLKHEEMDEATYQIYDKIRGVFYEFLQEYGVEL